MASEARISSYFFPSGLGWATPAKSLFLWAPARFFPLSPGSSRYPVIFGSPHPSSNINKLRLDGHSLNFLARTDSPECPVSGECARAGLSTLMVRNSIVLSPALGWFRSLTEDAQIISVDEHASPLFAGDFAQQAKVAQMLDGFGDGRSGHASFACRIGNGDNRLFLK